MNPLKELLELAQQREDLDRRTVNTVAKARAEKHSWQAIANVIGGTKQAAQQRYGKAVEPLMEQGRYDCSCGWTIVYPGWEAEEARDDIAAHQDEHYAEDERDEYGTEPAELATLDDYAPEQIIALAAAAPRQLENETATDLDEKAPAPAGNGFNDPFCTYHGWHHPRANCTDLDAAKKPGIITPKRTDAPQVDRDADETMDRIESGELDTEGFTIDWSQKDKPGICAKCSMTHHYSGKGRNLYFWIGPECNPTHRDTTQHKTN